jgi:hypothetical protein
VTSAPFGRDRLSAAGLLHTARRLFAQITGAPGHDIALVDHHTVLAGSVRLEYSTPLQSKCDHGEDATIRTNLTARYGIGAAPSDTRLCARLDVLDLRYLHPLYKALLASLQHA